jgi:DNA-binding transcriptional MerR regulator
VRSSAPSLSASEAARRLGVSTKALRLYEQRGLLALERTEAGYRVYGRDAMVRAGEIVALRALGLSLLQVARVLKGDARSLELALTAHEATLESEIRKLVDTIDKLRNLRADLGRGQAPAAGELASLLRPSAELGVAFELPWPWGGERFELNDIRPINYIVGPLGSGKTRLAQRLAETLPKAAFLGVERLDEDGASAATRMAADAALKSRVDQTLERLVDEGATAACALIALLVGLEAEGPAVVVVDMVEQGLDHATQEALMGHLRQRPKAQARPLFLMTRSSAILDLAAIGPDEAILLCPANHSPPTRVASYRGAPGWEAVATCLASPQVRARTAGVIAWRSQVSSS